MFSSKLLSCALFASSLFAGSSCGLPQLNNAKLERRVDCDPMGKYTTTYFLDNMCDQPVNGQMCLFYTRGLSKQAIELSELPRSFLKTIWTIWDRSLYILANEESNPLRCIMDDETQRRSYFANMSRAMATKCEGPSASVMDLDIHNVYMDSIWGQVEFPQLQRSDNPVAQPVDHVEATNDSGTDSTGFWDRNPTTKREAPEDIFHSEERKRADCGVGADVAVEFDVGGSHPVDW